MIKFVGIDMDFWVIIFIAGLIYLGYRFYEQNSPTKKIGRLEERSEHYFDKAIEAINKTIKEYEDRLGEKDSVIAPGVAKGIIKERTEYLEKIHSTEQMFLRLKEKYKHETGNKRLNLYQDWYDYCLSLSRAESAMEALHYDPSDDALDTYAERVKEHQVIIDETAKRFKKLLNR